MADPENSSDYLVGRFFVGLFALLAILMILNIAWEIHSGAAHFKTGGTALRASDPDGFWTDLALQGVMALFFGWQSCRLRQFARR